MMIPLQALTAGVLGSLLLQWPRPVWSDYVRDIIAGLSCLALHLRNSPAVALSLSIAYAVWNLLPGTFASLDLPNYATFMRTTTLVQPKDGESDECKVCWDTSHPLAQLPCGHHCCEGCLQLMNEHFQTACPMCRRPLFSAYDRAIFVVTKASVACGAVNTVLHLLVCVHEARSAQPYGAALAFGISCALGRYLWVWSIIVQEFGADWWRGAPKTVGLNAMSLRSAGLALVTGIFLLCQTLWTNRAIFR
jgi:hypothetical protein